MIPNPERGWPRRVAKSISFAGDIPWNEFTIITAKDIRDSAGENYVALILNDQPYLADELVNHPEEPILLLAHADKYLLEEAHRVAELLFPVLGFKRDAVA